VDRASGVLFGEHGMTLEDWNVIAGVYFKAKGDQCEIVILIEGSKDVGFRGDQTGGAWTGKIMSGIKNALSERR
jgi:hypothetical protein